MRPIDADAVQEYAEAEFFYDESKVVEYALSIAPTLSYKDLVPQGEWERLDDEVYRCTNCHHAPIANIDDKFVLSNFCPNCGARMREK